MVADRVKASDKKRLGLAVGADLARTHGKKPHYTVKQVKESVSRQRFSADLDCWALSMYTAQPDFDAHHRSIGETCDYGAMREQMTEAVTEGASSSWFDVDMSWLEWPDIDIDSLVDIFD